MGDGKYIDRSHNVTLAIVENTPTYIAEKLKEITDNKKLITESHIQETIKKMNLGLYVGTSTPSNYDHYHDRKILVDAIIRNNRMVKF